MLPEEGHSIQNKPRHMFLNFDDPSGTDALNMLLCVYIRSYLTQAEDTFFDSFF